MEERQQRDRTNSPASASPTQTTDRREQAELDRLSQERVVAPAVSTMVDEVA
jgi:hypothetical protein